MKERLRGSQTLEASIVVTLVLGLMIFLLYQTFYFYNRTALQEISRRELVMILEQLHTKEEAEEEIKENLYFIDTVSADCEVTEGKAVLNIQAQWAGKELPFFQTGWLAGSISVSTELNDLSGTDKVRRRELTDFGE